MGLVRTRYSSVSAFVAIACVLGFALVVGHSVAQAADGASVTAATLRDPANDVRAGDVDLTSVSVGKRDGTLVVRFTVRKPITDNVSYTASVRAGLGSWALVARRSGTEAFLLYNLATGSTTSVTGVIGGRSATVRAPIAQLGGQTTTTLGRVSAYFRAEPVSSRSGDADRAASVGPTVWFCLTDRRPRPRWGPCIWPGQTR